MSKDEEIASLKEALAAAKGYPDLDFPDAPPQETDRQAAVRWMRRAEAAERARDAANALLREILISYSPHFELQHAKRIRAHLAGQPAAPARDAESLATQGLHVVTAADKAVLDAMSRAHIDDTQNDYGGPVMLISEEHAVCRAELARRGSAK